MTRLLFVEGNADGTVGGSYYILLDLVRALDRGRYEPIVVFTHENIVAERLRESGIRVIIRPPVRPLVFRSAWLNRIAAPLKKVANLLNGFFAPALREARFLRQERIDLVNLNNSITANHSWMLAALMTRTPCITHEMGINARYPFLGRFLGARLDAVICLSEAILRAMRDAGVDYPHATVIHCPFDPARYHLSETPAALRERFAIPEGAPVIGVVGNIRSWKGQETIVRATHLLRRRHPGIRCVLAGGTSPRDIEYDRYLHAISDELDLGAHVIFAGFAKNPIDYMRLMDVVAHTSTSPEPFGIVLLEAMLLGKPLVSTTIGGPAEVVVDGETGVLVDPGRPELLAAAIDDLLAHPDRAAAMGRKAQERLRSVFALERTVGETVAVYERVLSARR